MAIRGRAITIAAGMLALLVMGFAVRQRRWFEVQYYALRLGRDPAQFLKFCTAAPNSSWHDAVRKFLRTAEGKDTLVQTYLDVALASDEALSNSLDEVQVSSEGAWLLVWAHGNRLRRMTYFDSTNGSHRAGGSQSKVEGRTYHRGPVEPLLFSLQVFLVEVGFDRYPLPRAPDLTFSVVTRRDREENILGSWMAWQYWEEGHVALIERIQRQCPRQGN
jgi:hypothetical protein